MENRKEKLIEYDGKKVLPEFHSCHITIVRASETWTRSIDKTKMEKLTEILWSFCTIEYGTYNINCTSKTKRKNGDTVSAHECLLQKLLPSSHTEQCQQRQQQQHRGHKHKKRKTAVIQSSVFNMINKKCYSNDMNLLHIESHLSLHKKTLLSTRYGKSLFNVNIYDIMPYSIPICKWHTDEARERHWYTDTFTFAHTACAFRINSNSLAIAFYGGLSSILRHQKPNR